MFQDHKIAYLRKRVKVRDAQRLSFLRQSVAYLLSLSARKVPHAAMVSQFDVTPLVEYARATESVTKEGAEQTRRETLLHRAIRRNFSAFFVKAFAHALHHVPCMNAFLDYTPWRNGGTLYCAEDINLSFTVDTKGGVIRPIVRNPHLKVIETVANEMRDLARKSRRTDPEELYRRAARVYVWTALRELDFRAIQAGWILLRALLWSQWRPDPGYQAIPEEDKLQVSDILGATCTVANIGMMVPGVQTVTVIVPPEVMLFGIGDLHQAPCVVDGKVVPRYVISMSATMDHRAFDAGEAFPFYEHLKRYIDNPALIYEWKPGDPL